MTDPAVPAVSSPASDSPSTPPVAEQRPIERTFHGDTFVDRYEWLRDKDDAAVIAHLEAENAYTEGATAHLEPLRERIFTEIKDRTQETDLSVPVREGDWWYYARTVEGSQYAIRCRRPVAGPDDWTPPAVEPAADGAAIPGEQVLLDSNAEAEGHEFFSLGAFEVSPDGSLLAYSTDTEGDERFTLKVRDLATGEDLADEISGTSHGATFSAHGDHLFYVTVDDVWRPDTVWRHRVGSPASQDVKVFTEPDESYFVGFGMTRSRQYLVIEVGSKITTEVLLLDAGDPTGSFRPVWPRRHGVEYDVDHAVIDGSDRLLILHNDGATNFELVDVPADDPTSTTDRQVVIPHDDEVRLEDASAFADHLVISYRREGLTRVGVIPFDRVLDGEQLHEIAFDEPIYTVGTAGNPEFAQPTVRLGYTSLATPATTYDYVLATRELRLLKQQPVRGGYDPDDYVQTREWATAEDGTEIPLSVVYKRGLVHPGTPAPLLLYGYGSYEASIDPSFSIARLSLLDRGMAFVIAHVRGGGEMGRRWYDEGKTLTKKNTFTDFVAAADRLIARGWTSPENLVAEGRSAGGLLMGAVANIAPDRFAGILAGVPFVDALTSILDPSLPLTVIEWDEWGDPLHDPEVYAYMKSYTPYENVREGVEYPRILAVTSLNDTRVLYVEPAKWTARLREAGAPVLLRTEMQAGHGGKSGRYDAWRERASDYAWVLDVAGLA
ncbi:S9 family peptidase [Clavibacter michiganensis subsp. insidiosus]|uniref:S9 family peptidase n=1 Tax=Clavibacter michiganensis subsp. insidiosus TaxID=33014 RepID=A0A399SM71_9MICO|nr:S9 family peptidase [Clavibacter michiganensis]AWG01927.1 protease 2 [Clavibacter michiganensis subsp. insidiosus]OQJ59575.1 oligopeptidase B [Clavibacter michiganensis subsp. insidiosus]RII88675.1 S9 family peptidase [Clavibacter michiganensis subsp. insidiosus]RIJ43533.1 S9 family peptidase [Clavibacter michiganensis subsp. insidiosus]RMC88046.1 S9 family peptidase [Clavibacter michiganensis subsp. insidiosus]